MFLMILLSLYCNADNWNFEGQDIRATTETYDPGDAAGDIDHRAPGAAWASRNTVQVGQKNLGIIEIIWELHCRGYFHPLLPFKKKTS